jgi:hypothetical protein
LAGKVVKLFKSLSEKMKDAKSGKDVSLLRIAHSLCRLTSGGQVVSCKSAKDRTSMCVTLDVAVGTRTTQQHYATKFPPPL